MMNKIIVSLLLSVGCLFGVYAENNPVPFTFKKRPQPVGNGGIGHAPMNLPVEVSFDDATGVLTVSAPEDMEGYVYVYNLSGVLEGSSQTLNVTFTLPKSGVHVISLEGETWIGEGKIVY